MQGMLIGHLWTTKENFVMLKLIIRNFRDFKFWKTGLNLYVNMESFAETVTNTKAYPWSIVGSWFVRRSLLYCRRALLCTSSNIRHSLILNKIFLCFSSSFFRCNNLCTYNMYNLCLFISYTSKSCSIQVDSSLSKTRHS